MPVGENGNVYRFPVEWGLPAPPPPPPKKKPKRVEVEEMTSFQDWLREMVDGKVIDQVGFWAHTLFVVHFRIWASF